MGRVRRASRRPADAAPGCVDGGIGRGDRLLRLTLGEPLGFAGPPAAAVACAPAAVFVFGQAPLT